MIGFIILGICLWLGLKSGIYILELKKQDTVSLNELMGLGIFIILFPISIVMAIIFFFENNGNKIVIKRKAKNQYCTCKNPIYTAVTLIEKGKVCDFHLCTKCKKEMNTNSG